MYVDYEGAIYDKTKDYNYSFYMMGICIMVSGVMLYPIPCIQRALGVTTDSADVALGKKPVGPATPDDEAVALNEITASTA
jgi:hypothetical protein